MIDRATALLDQGCGRISGGTFHGFANLMLRRLVPELRDCTIIDQSDSFDIIGELRAELGLGARGKSFPRKETLAAILSKAANFEVSITDVVNGEYPHLITDIPLLKQLGQRYAEFKQARKLLDYDDLLIELARPPATPRRGSPGWAGSSPGSTWPGRAAPPRPRCSSRCVTIMPPR